jgi:hypothetical protein
MPIGNEITALSETGKCTAMLERRLSLFMVCLLLGQKLSSNRFRARLHLPDLFCQFLSGFEAGIPLRSYLYRFSSTRVPPLPGFLVLYDKTAESP